MNIGHKLATLVTLTSLASCTTTTYFDTDKLLCDSIITTSNDGEMIQRTTFTYDTNGNETGRATWQIATPGAPLVLRSKSASEYDANGRKTSSTEILFDLGNDTTKMLYKYNERGVLIAQTTVSSDGQIVDIEMDLDSADHTVATKVTTIDKTTNKIEHQIAFHTLDSLGREVLMDCFAILGDEQKPDSRIEKRYDENGNIVSSALYLINNGVWEPISADSTIYENGRAQIRIEVVDEGETRIQESKYDAAGNLTNFTEFIKDCATNQRVIESSKQYEYGKLTKTCKNYSYAQHKLILQYTQTFYYSERPANPTIKQSEH